MARTSPRKATPWGAAVVLLVLVSTLTGGLGNPFSNTEVPFETVKRDHFDALTVEHERVAPSDEPLVLRVALIGDRDELSFLQARAWLRENVNVVVVEDPEGAPLYLTTSDLSATSGRATLGATLRTGMAVEVRDGDLAPCILAHEMLHFLGLRHDADPDNIMGPHCTPHKLDFATIRADQVDHVARLSEIRALTTSGAEVWATRGR